MLTLGLDTAAEQLSLALADGDRLLAGLETVTRPHAQAEQLFPALEALFDLAGRRPGEVERIAVATGPGSYTGLRNGLAVARTLGQLNRVPIMGVDSLTLLLARCPLAGLLCPWLDIRRGEVYTALVARRYSAAGAEVEVLAASGARSPQAWLEQLLSRKEPIAVLGSGVAAWADQLAGANPPARIIPDEQLACAGATLTMLAERPEAAGVPLTWGNYEEVSPRYPDRPVAQARSV